MACENQFLVDRRRIGPRLQRSTIVKWLSQEWLDESKRLAETQPVRPGASARLQYVITDGPDGDIEYYWVVVDGRLSENRLGELSDAEVTLTETYDDAMALQKGELDANAAFMQGKVKVTGDVNKLMSLLPITMSPEFHEFNQAVLAITEF
jgi:putative sterol carrier protein